MRLFQMLFFLTLLGTSTLSAQHFEHNATESFALAKAEKKQVLMIFSGSDWCKPCIQMRQSIIKDPSFVAFSEQHLVLLELDFPYRKKNKLKKEQREHNEQLAEQYNQEGSFPKLVLLDANEAVVGQINYKKNMTTQAFIDQITELQVQE